VFPQQLTTTSTWSDVCSIANAGDSYKPTATTHVQLADHGALCAQGESVRRIFYVAPRNDSSIIN
jgi:hypothetical protein